MTNPVTTITIIFDRILEVRQKAIKLQIPFKVDNREYYWGFWLPKTKVLIGNDNRIIIPTSFLSQMKLSLQHHTFSEVRYVARFNKYKITFIKA